ncbi:hypothetical protein FH972_009551 [Carpinus fangiana]|uniref:Uncharacterized protein n=1 Tax=Carpinus fangiana TaxID=176857 RepID=A0A660KRR7_9ROSI|nr:hypothetical protein FH972_009551 [Carpinus fangiana]
MGFPAGTASGSLISTTTQSDIKNVFASGGSADNFGVFTVGDKIQAGLSALEDALQSGFEDFKRIRTDPDLANVRTSEEFDSLLKRFDESFINGNAINIKSLFGIFDKK